jgi:hypothetical protein
MLVRLKPGAPATLNTKVYPLTRAETEEWREFVSKNKLLKRIKDSKLPWASPVFFIHKKDGSFRLVQDY